MGILFVGAGNVELVDWSSDMAGTVASICKSATPKQPVTKYRPKLTESLVSMGHLSPLEFDNFTFFYSGYSRVMETQLVRKRCASYMIRSGRTELGGERELNFVLPANYASDDVKKHLLAAEKQYNLALANGIKEEDARYLLPQCVESCGFIQMNAHALLDFFSVRCCKNAQTEIRDLANKMLRLCKEVAPEHFKLAGPKCLKLGYCPEGNNQNKDCNMPKGTV